MPFRIMAAARPAFTSISRTYITAAESAVTGAAEGHYKVTQTRSLIGVPKTTIKGRIKQCEFAILSKPLK